MWTWLCWMAIAAASPMDDLRHPLGDGAWINWSRMVVEVDGEPGEGLMPGAFRAHEDAARQQVEARVAAAALQVPVRAGTTVQDVAPQAVRRAVAEWMTGEARYHTRGTVEITGEVSLTALLTEWNLSRSEAAPPRGSRAGGATGLVIDARGVAVQPVYAPRITDPDGQVLFDAVLWAQRADDASPVAWVTDPAHPAAQRAGDRPVYAVARASRADTLIVDADTAARLRESLAGRRPLGEGTVAIVVSP